MVARAVNINLLAFSRKVKHLSLVHAKEIPHGHAFHFPFGKPEGPRYHIIQNLKRIIVIIHQHRCRKGGIHIGRHVVNGNPGSIRKAKSLIQGDQCHKLANGASRNCRNPEQWQNGVKYHSKHHDSQHQKKSFAQFPHPPAACLYPHIDDAAEHIECQHNAEDDIHIIP